MRLPGPHELLQVALIEPVAVGLLLGALHDVVEIIRRKLGLFAALEDFLLEQIAGIDIHHHLGRALDLRFEHRQFLLRILRGRKDCLGDDGLAHRGGGLGQRHGRDLLQDGLASLIGAFIVEGMSQLVRQRADLVQRAIEVGQDAAFLYALHFHAECAAALAFALLGVDPVVIEGAFGKGASSGENFPKFSRMKSRASSKE